MNLEESLIFDKENFDTVFLFKLNSLAIIDNYVRMVYRPLETETVYELECKVRPNSQFKDTFIQSDRF